MLEKKIIEDEYERKISAKLDEIDNNYNKFKFLHNLLTETGDKLVNSVIEYFKWLGVSDVKSMDKENKNLLEEDLQISTNKGLVLIEIKGIGGTSKDYECSQISKNILRRIKELKRTDIFGFYLVNHERYKPPLQRKNPPFTAQQIDDANNSDRGLLTTWQLFKLYSHIELGLISKSEAIEHLTDFGLIEFEPNFRFTVEINNIYKRGDNTIVSIEISNIKICVNDYIYIKKHNDYLKLQVLNIQVNKTDINEIENGIVGLLLNGIVEKNSIICIK